MNKSIDRMIRLLAQGVAIVASILLAFAIQAWWESRLLQLEEQELLDALRSELVVARQSFVEQREYLAEDIQIAKDTVHGLENSAEGTTSAEVINALASNLGPSRRFRPHRAALNDLLNTGGIALIQSDSLRRAIASYEQSLTLDANAQDLLVELWLEHMAPYRYVHGAMAAYIEGLEIAESAHNVEQKAFVGNRIYRNLLLARVRRTEDVRIFHNEVIDRIDGILLLLP